MARDTLQVSLRLERVRCFDEGDGWGDSEPYLWTVFFKVDGASVVLSDALMLSGTGTIMTTPGSHGNLGDTDVGAGDDLAIPSAIGAFETVLRPISVPSFVQGVIADVGGVVGVACVLMEEDNVTDDGAEAGHQALNLAVESAINAMIPTLGVSNQELSDDAIAAAMSGIPDQVTSAIREQQNVFENI